jgi:hypothetical protein
MKIVGLAETGEHGHKLSIKFPEYGTHEYYLAFATRVDNEEGQEVLWTYKPLTTLAPHERIVISDQSPAVI